MKLGNTSFSDACVAFLKTATVEEAIRVLKSDHVNENRIVNAWKKANPGKSAKVVETEAVTETKKRGRKAK